MPPERKIQNELRIFSLNGFYQINLKDSTGKKFPRSEWRRLPYYIIAKDSEFSTDTLLGRPCLVIHHKGNVDKKTWIWKGIILREEFLEVRDYYYATSIEENYKIKPDEFSVPTFIKIK